MVINDIYRFWFDIPGAGITQVFPFNSQLKWVDKKKTGYRFYQRTLETQLILMDEPAEDNFGFTLLMNIERQGRTCEKINVTMDKYCDCDASWHDEIYKGYLRLNAGEWDVSGCTVRIPIVVQDKFTCLTTSWTNEVNMFDYGDPPVTISPFVGVLQRVTCEGRLDKRWEPPVPPPQATTWINNYFWNHLQTDCLYDVTPGSTNAPWSLTKHTHITEWEFRDAGVFGGLNMWSHTRIRTSWVREYYAGAVMPDGSGWVAVPGGFARGVNVVETPTLDFTTNEGLIALQEEWDTTDFNIGILARWTILGEDANGNVTFTNGIELAGLLRDLLEPCGLTVISNFLNINPDATAPANEYYTNAAIDFYGIVLYQISDVARIDESQSATIGIMQLKKLLDALKVAGNLDADIDGTTLRIEHVSYWPDNVQMDLTLPEFYKFIKDKWKYTYDQEGQPKTEVVAWDSETDFKGNDFDGYPIEYDNSCVNDVEEKTDKTYAATGYLSNLLKIVGNEDYYDDTERFVMVSTKNLVIQSALQPISGFTKLNGNLAMGYLIPRYYTYDRPFKEGFINKILTAFYSSRRLRLQAEITIPFDCNDYLNNYTPSGLIKTQLGAGQIETATFTDPDQTLSIKLRQK